MLAKEQSDNVTGQDDWKRLMFRFENHSTIATSKFDRDASGCLKPPETCVDEWQGNLAWPSGSLILAFRFKAPFAQMRHV
mmetsp:Transcript_9880/g.19758  ORF Transcript_9880/g.19758 Transcript_9880/m.19758 type:complete len:80 (+) Transcript_9880:1810-2049(+)